MKFGDFLIFIIAFICKGDIAVNIFLKNKNLHGKVTLYQ
jgi:hypothetical protein